jgi:flagellar biosynthesis GTPase FlhF
MSTTREPATSEAEAELTPFVASTVEDAVAQVRSRLGPAAVVVHVRRIPVQKKGWFRRSPRQRFEILAYRPKVGGLLDAASDAPAMPETAPSRDDSSASNGRVVPAVNAFAPESVLSAGTGRTGGGAWRVAQVLEASGFQPAHAQRVADQLLREHGEKPPESLAMELSLARAALATLWRRPPSDDGIHRAHVLIGAPGAGKTTCLSKWATQAVLTESRKARIWRLDGQTSNTAEWLNVHCEILGIPMERRWRPGTRLDPEETHWVDLPGVDWRSGSALRGLARQIEGLGPVRIHLVVNGAYDVPLLLQQIRAFSALPVDDLIISHLDEETRWGKIWNLVLGTKYGIRFLSAGQNIPGDFLAGSAETLFSRQFPS